MQRKEVYATTGPRMIVRFFGGWDFDAKDALSRNPATSGYTKGVPMGGDISNAPAGKSPSFLVAALKDPIRANLDRLQVIKGWLDASGQTHEKIYDVAVSGNRQIGADGRCNRVGPRGQISIDLPIFMRNQGEIAQSLNDVARAGERKQRRRGGRWRGKWARRISIWMRG